MRILATAHHWMASADAVPASNTATSAAPAPPTSEFILSNPAIIQRDPVAVGDESAVEFVRGGDQRGEEEP
ncbi:MAG TPA: hypothetical protein VFI97_06995 [Arthrobacter sp.]|nr:hypothetical protein [Arthrobacter sp.]